MHTNAARHLPSRKLRPPMRGDLGSIALLLDVDGTIVDTAATPGGVDVPRSLHASLEELHAKCGGALALVSGRLIRDLDGLFAPLQLPAIGAHGADMELFFAEPIDFALSSVESGRPLLPRRALLSRQIQSESSGR